MILLDTNVVSEAMRPTPAAQVLDWLDAQASATLFLSSVSLAELLLGIALLPDGRRKAALEATFAQRVTEVFAGRILPFDGAAAATFAVIVSRARTSGISIGMADAQIAAIAAENGLIVATRDRRPFEAAGLRVIDPWSIAG